MAKVIRKKGKKQAKRSKVPTVVDGISTTEMSHSELEEHIVRLREELERERQERNYFQAERDKVNNFWEVTKYKLEECSSELRNKEREMEEAEDRHQLELRIYKQKVKHMLYEHQNSLLEIKSETVNALKSAQEENSEVQEQLKQNYRNLKLMLKEKEYSNEDCIRQIKMKHEQQMHILRDDCLKQLQQQKELYLKKIKDLRDELSLQTKNQIHETEERKNSQINNLMANHEKSFAEIKNYYNDITLNNLALISNLKEQLEEKRKKEDRLERQATDLLAENRRLKEPLSKATEENAELKRKMEHYERDKIALRQTKALLKNSEDQRKQTEWKFDILEQRFKHIENERDELRKKFVSTIHELQQKAGLKNLLLEKRLTALTEEVEKKEAHVSEVLTVSNLDPAALAIATKRMNEILESKNVAIKELQYELARVCKAHGDLLKVCESKMHQLGISKDELGFIPFKSSLYAPILGQAPAGLVSVPP